MSDAQKKKGVLLLAFGGADKLDDVEPFIRNVLKSRPVSVELIERATERYRLIGGSSPLLSITRAQARALEDVLNADTPDAYRVYVGMRNWLPYIKDTLKTMQDDGIEDAMAVIMAAHRSKTATGGYAADVEDALKTISGRPSINYLPSWHTHPLYIELLVDSLNLALAELSSGPSSSDERLVIFSAHSLPEPALRGDDYVDKINETIKAVCAKKDINWRLGYQSKGGGVVKWLGPMVEEVMEEFASSGCKEGAKAVIIVPLGFVSDHVETLYDIDILFKEHAESLGLEFSRAASLNTNDKFIKMLAELIVEEDK